MTTATAPALEIRCFGGLEVRRGGAPVTGFESRKVRALFAYLVCQRGRAFPRQRLAALFWPDKPAEAARRNLRQAVYNVKSVIGADATRPPIEATKGSLQIASHMDYWLDVWAFDQALASRTTAGGANPHALAGAVRLYRGEFLADLPLHEETPFDDWVSAERERLREGLITALRTLITSYLGRGEYRLGIQYAQRLVSLDPLSEEAHGYLMQLYARSGRRSQALEQYRGLQGLLANDLGVEPLEETQRLYETILRDESRLGASVEDRPMMAPLIPLVGRQSAFRQLTAAWESVLAGGARLTTVVGEAGCGKTRLARSFLDSASSLRPVTVLIGDCVSGPLFAFQPWSKLLRSAFLDPALAHRILPRLVPEAQGILAWLVTELRDQHPEISLPPAAAAGGYPALVDAIEGVLRAIVEAGGVEEQEGAVHPVIVFIDDLDGAGAETLSLLIDLAARLADRPVWILATAQAGSTAHQQLAEAASESRLALDEVVLQPLSGTSVTEIANWLVGREHGDQLATLLYERTEGVPVGLAEVINHLWDEGALIAEEGGQWRLDPSHWGLVAAPETDLEDVVARRLTHLPASARRLTTLAAIIGQEFGPDVMRIAADEHAAVVDIGLELMIERWLMRRYAVRWTSSRRPHDIVSWAKGARRGSFEFAHKRTREVIYNRLQPSRRRVLHLQIAQALESLYTDDRNRVCELLAYHYTRAEVWAQALPALQATAAKARALGADALVEDCEQRCAEMAQQIETNPPRT